MFVLYSYTYIFFGSTEAVVSRPSVEVRRGTEVVIPQACCTFPFATTPQHLHDAFYKCVLRFFRTSVVICRNPLWRVSVINNSCSEENSDTNVHILRIFSAFRWLSRCGNVTDSVRTTAVLELWRFHCLWCFGLHELNLWWALRTELFCYVFRFNSRNIIECLMHNRGNKRAIANFFCFCFYFIQFHFLIFYFLYYSLLFFILYIILFYSTLYCH